MPEGNTRCRILASGNESPGVVDPTGRLQTGATYVDGVRVTCRPALDHLQIVVNNKAWTKELFGDKPETVQFETGGTQLKRAKTTVTVDYQLERKKSDG